MTLEHVLKGFLRQPFAALEPELRGILLSGGAQLLLLDRVPPHAALNESVELAKRLVRTGAGGLVNAVLRKVAALRGETGVRPDDWAGSRSLIPLGDGRVRALSIEAFPDDPLQRLAVGTSHPRWLIDRWSTSLGSARAADLALHDLGCPPTILNTAFASGPLPASLVPHSRPGHHVFGGTRAELAELLSARPDIWVQDPASSVAIGSIRDARPSLIVDLCAGQGTKTRQLAASFPGARIIATDVDAARYRTLAAFWHGHQRVRVLPIEDAARESDGRAGVVLLDVPCSNSGVLARRAEAKYRCSSAQLDRLIAIQRQIIDRAVPLLAPGGVILYSTCSIDAEENEAQARWACGRHGLALGGSSSLLPAGLPGDPPALYHDGSFSAVLRRAG